MTTILAISRQLGSGGSIIGQTVASRLGLRYADRDILRDAAVKLGVEEAELEPFEERARSFWDRVVPLFAFSGAEGYYAPLSIPAFHQDDIFEAERRIMREIANRGDAVIVGRAAAWVLRDLPGLVSIYVHAPEAARVRRVSEVYHLAAADATALVHRSDRQRAAFVESLTGQPWTTALRYDVCVNTESVGLDAAADIVAGLMTRRRAP